METIAPIVVRRSALEFTIALPPFQLSPSMTFTHKTRIADSWLALVERVLMPSYQYSQDPLTVRVFEGSTAEVKARPGTRHPLRYLRQRMTIDMPGTYLFDMRFETESNMGHFVVSEVPMILMIRKRLSAELGRPVDIHIILRAGASAMAQQIFENVGIPVVQTDAHVRGMIIDVKSPLTRVYSEGQQLREDKAAPYSLVPLAYADFDFEDAARDTPEKIFISRKHSRTITNEDEITELLAARGYEKVYYELEERSVRDQWRISAGAREIVGIHGAALSTLAFNRHGLARPPGDLSGLRMIELFGAGYFVDFNRQLMAVMNGHWCGVRGQLTPEIVRDVDIKQMARSHQASSFHVDPESLEMALDYSASICAQSCVTTV